MTCDIRHVAAVARTHVAVAFLALSGLTFVVCDEAWSQAATVGPQGGSQTNSEAAETPPPAAVSPPPVAPRPENPGLINEIGKLLEGRQPLFPALTLPQPQQPSPAPAPAVADPAGQDGDPAPRGQPDNSGLPRFDLKIPSMQTGREKCPVAANGASDCKAAADVLCRAHGYKEGKSTDTDATQKCSAEALLLSGRKSQPGACRTDYFVTRAWCQ
ncbi:MAG: hypothetical protein ACTHNN_21125 [Xanthobacteraceae bacterium]